MIKERLRIVSLAKINGFSIPEAMASLAIFVLLLGGAIQGTNVHHYIQVLASVSMIEDVATGVYAYQDRYRRIPGDDGRNLLEIRSRGGNWVEVDRIGNNNHILDADRQNTFNGHGEQEAFWQHLRAAGFLKGEVNANNALPKNIFGGVMGVTTSKIHANLGGTKICLSQVPGAVAINIDKRLDDGNGETGDLRATLSTANANTPPSYTEVGSPYGDSQIYSLCLKI